MLCSTSIKFSIEYKVQEYGWVEVYISDGKTTIDSPVSYLHDSLCELAEMAISIKAGHKESKVVFMDEPGELLLVATLDGDQAHYEARWYKDWASWGIGSESEFKPVLQGVCASSKATHQITKVLWYIHQDIEPEKYKELWGEHEFPEKQFTELSNA